jgi:hypothetical protein
MQGGGSSLAGKAGEDMYQSVDPDAPPMTKAEFDQARQIYFDRCRASVAAGIVDDDHLAADAVAQRQERAQRLEQHLAGVPRNDDDGNPR